EFVRRHQAVVAGVAYSVCGDFATSEDVAQDAFLTAWQTWSTLREPGRGKAWVCGIARHLAADEHRRCGRRREELSTSSDEEAGESREGEPLELAARNEQQRMVWSALEELPPLYRETLVLFYRDEHSVAAVAEALAITPDAVKQRLARGRELLRHQMTALVESALSTSRPKSSFTASVLAAVAVLSGAAKASAATAPLATASAAGGGVLAKTVFAAATASATAGVIGGLAGTAGGLAGGWLGAWIPAQLAATNREREAILRVGRRMFAVSATASLFLVTAMLLLSYAGAGTGAMLATSGSWTVLYTLYIGYEVIHQYLTLKRIRRETNPGDDANTSPWLKLARERAARIEGRIYRSRMEFLGRPLIDIQVSDPAIGCMPRTIGTNTNTESPSASDLASAEDRQCDDARRTTTGPRTARGWIAIGDRADGILLAIGGRARGLIAFGGLSFGLVSIGGVAVGGVAIGGVGVGVIGLGGLGLGAIAFGGLAIGWQAMGGAALAYDFACGG
ncbi:MAG TPA: sigma-70 family RNA polymerase sigma factor, partial [Pirellulaceae bacterium]|nr:sigma-70 family RNA polymerase sigma factor [Pirellulaceae bacterium]